MTTHPTASLDPRAILHQADAGAADGQQLVSWENLREALREALNNPDCH